MKILSIETSCDDTGIAILEVSGDKKSPDFSVLANIIASQIEVHQKYGGVYPMMAKREHQRNLLPTLTKALKESNLLKPAPSVFLTTTKNTDIEKILEREPELFEKIVPFLQKYEKPDIDLISITNGPGLEPCLWVGVNFAKCLSYFWNIPIVPVNHIESHILVNFLNIHHAHKICDSVKSGHEKILFPAVCLVVSGGHTQIILMNKIGKYEILGETRDDAAGECFDKCAKILGLGYPGGPIISKLAENYTLNPKTYTLKLPRPMIYTKDYDFSFSGLKTAVLYADKKVKTKNLKYKKEMASEVQQAIIDVLIKKTIKATKDYKAKTIILGGGVSANKALRKQFLQFSDTFKIIFPKPELSTDNGLMTAITGFYHKNKTVDWQKISADGNLRIK